MSSKKGKASKIIGNKDNYLLLRQKGNMKKKL